MDDLEKQFGAERRMMVDDALNKLNERYDKLRDDMMKRHEKELADLLVSVGFYEYYLCCNTQQAPRLECVLENYFLNFSSKTYVVGTQKNRLNEVGFLSTQNSCLMGKKIIKIMRNKISLSGSMLNSHNMLARGRLFSSADSVFKQFGPRSVFAF